MHVVQTAPAVSPPQTVKPKANRAHQKRVRHKKTQVTHVRSIARPKASVLPSFVPAGAEAAPQSSAAAIDYTRSMIIAVITLSIFVFAIAAVPVRLVPWRTAAQFIHQRHVDLTLFGVVLLAAAGVAILLTKH